MHQVTLAPTATISDIWDTIVRSIGGKRIKSFSMACSRYNNFSDISNFKKDTYSDAILLKNSHRIILCTYCLRNRDVIFQCSLDDVDQLFYHNDSNEHIILLHTIDDGLYWRLNITI